MHRGWKIASVCLRLWELICAIVVCGFIGRYMNYLSAANVGFDSTVEFAMAMAAISIFASIVLTRPTKYHFWAFPFDACMFVCWIAVFGCLMEEIQHQVQYTMSSTD
jgi:hypothetical protein